MKLSRNLFIGILITANIVVDQLSKYWVDKTVDRDSVTELLGNLLTLRHVLNEGAFLGMGSELSGPVKLVVLLILPAIVLGFVVYHMIKEKHMDKLSLIGFSCVVGGGVSNIFDRFVHGSVIDFLHMDFGFVRTGIFNAADLSVTTGMVLILWSSFIHRKKTKSQEQA